MHSVTVSDQLYQKVAAFKEVIEAVLGEHLAFGIYIEMVLEEGIEAFLENLLALSDHPSLVRSFYELSSHQQVQVFEHVAERIRAGERPAGGRSTPWLEAWLGTHSERNFAERAADGTE